MPNVQSDFKLNACELPPPQGGDVCKLSWDHLHLQLPEDQTFFKSQF